VRASRGPVPACTLLIALLLPAASAAARNRYYLSLGDSLAQGMQPDASGIIVNTREGYADRAQHPRRRGRLRRHRHAFAAALAPLR